MKSVIWSLVILLRTSSDTSGVLSAGTPQVMQEIAHIVAGFSLQTGVISFCALSGRGGGEGKVNFSSFRGITGPHILDAAFPSVAPELL